MSHKIFNLLENDDVKVINQRGPFSILEYKRDLSIAPEEALRSYFMSEMGVRKRQVLCDLHHSEVITSSGAMQWMVGSVHASTDVRGAGDLLGKVVKGKVTGEPSIKPCYSGKGKLMLEPTYKHLLLWDMADWGEGVVLDDGLFMCCESTIKQTIKARSNLSSAVLGGEGLFNLMLKGDGVFCLESHCPEEELVTIELQNDTLKIDGNYAVAWSSSLSFTVEKTTKTLIGSAASGEGFVNVYSGTGKVVMAPVR